MKKLSREEIEEIVSNISEKVLHKELESMPGELDDLCEMEKDSYSLLASLFPFSIGYNYRICTSIITEVLSNIMDE